MQASTTTTTSSTAPTAWKFLNGVSLFTYDMLFDSVYIGQIVNNAMNFYFALINLLEGNTTYLFELGH